MTLKRFLEPRSIAVIGASEIPGKAGHAVMSNLLANKYPGKIFPVNRTADKVMGLAAYHSAKDLPEVPDVAVLVVPASATLDTVRDCAERSIKALVIVSAGFTEVDEKGAAIQDSIVKLARENGMRVIGPNTAGLISTPSNLNSAFFPIGKVRRGTVAYVAQTGNFAGATMRWILSAENFGVSRVISLGNKCDVDESDALEYLGQDSDTKVICLYLEGFGNGRRFIQVARKVSRKKPIIALKGGLSKSGAKAAASHTASLGGNNPAMIAGIFEQAGISRVRRFTDLMDIAKAFAFQPLPKGRRVVIIVPSGAMGVLAADACEELGLNVAQLTEKSLAKLRSISASWIKIGNPIDIWPAVQTVGLEKAYGAAIGVAMQDGGVDAVIPVFLGMKEEPTNYLRFVRELARMKCEKPLLFSFSGDRESFEAMRNCFERHSLPVYLPVEGACEALATMYRCSRFMSR
jgi:acyl-CoA synthetase (NDP forming)